MFVAAAATLLSGLLSGASAQTQPAASAPTPQSSAAQASPAAGAAPAASADPFPPTDPKYFTAKSPTPATVDGFLRAIWGYDPTRIWRVAAIQATQAPGVSKVTVFVADRGPNAKVQTSSFFVTPDGKHAIAGDGIVSFGARPFEDARLLLEQNADGAHRGASSKALELVEFADLQCPHCKEAQSIMDRLVKDFPGAHIVYQSFPLTEIHPFAFKAAADGICIQQKSNEAFFPYAEAVYATQEGLTAEDGDQTLKNAITKAGMPPAAIEACAATPATRAAVESSIRLGTEVGVDQTPMLAVNGHLLPLTQLPYETLKQIINYQAKEDGSAAVAAAKSASPAR